MRHYSASRLKVIRECPRKHYLQYELGIRMPATPAMAFGTVAHAALEAYYRAWERIDMDGRLPDALAAVDASELSDVDRERMRVLIVAYHLRWSAADWHVLAVEWPFEYLIDDYRIIGRIDAIVRERTTGQVFALEHKSTSVDAAIGGPYWQRLTLDCQVSIYIDGANAIGYELAGCIYDVLKRPLHEPRLATPIDARKYTTGSGCSKCGGSGKAGAVVQGRGHYLVRGPGEIDDTKIDCEGCNATGWKLDKDGVPNAPRLHSNQRDTDETIEEYGARIAESIGADPDAFLIRGTVVRLDDELPGMRADLVDTIKLERAGHLFGLHPRNPDSCARYGRMCEMFAACSGAADINDESLFPRPHSAATA